MNIKKWFGSKKEEKENDIRISLKDRFKRFLERFRINANQEDLAFESNLIGSVNLQEPLLSQKSRITDPYLAAREVWNERYGSHIVRAFNWRIIAFVIGIYSIILSIGFVKLALQSKRIPYIVEVDKLGQAVNVGYAVEASPISQKIYRSFLSRFIIDLRSVSPDLVVQKQAIDRVFCMLLQGTPALEKIYSFFRESDPFKLGETKTVAVETIHSILPISNKTWQAEWTEIHRDHAGNLIGRVRMKATLSLQVNPDDKKPVIKENDPMFENMNPLGLFVEDINWTQTY